MKTIKFKNWELIVDKELTKSTYEKVEMGNSDSCVCNECKNYSNYRENFFPKKLKICFQKLELTIEKKVK